MARTQPPLVSWIWLQQIHDGIEYLCLPDSTMASISRSCSLTYSGESTLSHWRRAESFFNQQSNVHVNQSLGPRPGLFQTSYWLSTHVAASLFALRSNLKSLYWVASTLITNCKSNPFHHLPSPSY